MKTALTVLLTLVLTTNAFAGKVWTNDDFANGGYAKAKAQVEYAGTLYSLKEDCKQLVAYALACNAGDQNACEQVDVVSYNVQAEVKQLTSDKQALRDWQNASPANYNLYVSALGALEAASQFVK